MKEQDFDDLTLNELVAMATDLRLVPNLTLRSGCIELDHFGERVLLDPYQSRLFLRAVVRDFFHVWHQNRHHLPGA